MNASSGATQHKVEYASGYLTHVDKTLIGVHQLAWEESYRPKRHHYRPPSAVRQVCQKVLQLYVIMYLIKQRVPVRTLQQRRHVGS